MLGTENRVNPEAMRLDDADTHAQLLGDIVMLCPNQIQFTIACWRLVSPMEGIKASDAWRNDLAFAAPPYLFLGITGN
jgi:hypothetical protein